MELAAVRDLRQTRRPAGLVEEVLGAVRLTSTPGGCTRGRTGGQRPKLTPRQAKIAREMYDAGDYTVQQIADEFGVTRPPSTATSNRRTRGVESDGGTRQARLREGLPHQKRAPAQGLRNIAITLRLLTASLTSGLQRARQPPIPSDLQPPGSPRSPVPLRPRDHQVPRVTAEPPTWHLGSASGGLGLKVPEFTRTEGPSPRTRVWVAREDRVGPLSSRGTVGQPAA